MFSRSLSRLHIPASVRRMCTRTGQNGGRQCMYVTGVGQRRDYSRQSNAVAGLLERMDRGDIVTLAEGYIYAFERRGYCQAGSYVPEVVLEHPELVRQQHHEFAHAGSDILLACTYFANKDKLRVIGREDELDRLNLTALKIAREVADETGTLMAGCLGNTTVYNSQQPDNNQHVKDSFQEQVEWAVNSGADLIIAETFYDYGEALLALRAVQQHGKNIPVIVSLTPLPAEVTHDGLPLPEALRRLEKEGAVAVGLNCSRGPATMLPVLQKCRDVVQGHLGCVPVPYRTTDKEPVFMSLTHPETGENCLMNDMDMHFSGRTEISDFARKAKQLGVSYLGLCCGNMGAQFRAMCEGLGRQVPASRFSPDISKHFAYGDDAKVGSAYSKDHMREVMMADINRKKN